MFSSRSFMLSGLRFQSLIHFEFIFERSVREQSSLIFCMQLSSFPAPFRDSFPCCTSLPPLSPIRCPYKCEFLSGFSVPLIRASVFVPVHAVCLDYCNFGGQFEIGECDASTFVFLKIVLAISDVFPYKFQTYLFQFCEKCLWHFDRDCIDSLDCLGYMVILTILVLLVHEHSISFHLLVSYSVSFMSVLHISKCGIILVQLDLFLGILFFLMHL